MTRLWEQQKVEEQAAEAGDTPASLLKAAAALGLLPAERGGGGGGGDAALLELLRQRQVALGAAEAGDWPDGVPLPPPAAALGWSAWGTGDESSGADAAPWGGSEAAWEAERNAALGLPRPAGGGDTPESFKGGIDVLTGGLRCRGRDDSPSSHPCINRAAAAGECGHVCQSNEGRLCECSAGFALSHGKGLVCLAACAWRVPAYLAWPMKAAAHTAPPAPPPPPQAAPFLGSTACGMPPPTAAAPRQNSFPPRYSQAACRSGRRGTSWQRRWAGRPGSACGWPEPLPHCPRCPVCARASSATQRQQLCLHFEAESTGGSCNPGTGKLRREPPAVGGLPHAACTPSQLHAHVSPEPLALSPASQPRLQPSQASDLWSPPPTCSGRHTHRVVVGEGGGVGERGSDKGSGSGRVVVG